MSGILKKSLLAGCFVFISTAAVFAATYWLPDYQDNPSLGKPSVGNKPGQQTCANFNMLSSVPTGAECDSVQPANGLRCFRNCRCMSEYTYTLQTPNLVCSGSCTLNGVTKYKCSKCCEEGWTYNAASYSPYARTTDLKWLVCRSQPTNPVSAVYEAAKCSEGGQCGKCMAAKDACDYQGKTWCSETSVCVDKTQGGCCSDSDCSSGACIDNQCVDCSADKQKLCNGECIDLDECCGNAPARGCWCNNGSWETDCRAYSDWEFSCSSGSVDVCATTAETFKTAVSGVSSEKSFKEVTFGTATPGNTLGTFLVNDGTASKVHCSLSLFCSVKGMIADGDLVTCGSKKYGKCKSCPSGYSPNLTSEKCNGMEPETHATETACKKCPSCAAGYSFTTTIDDCGAGQVLETQAGNSACKRCSGVPCESGYSTTQKTVNNGYKLETQASNSQCTKLVECKATCSNTQMMLSGSSATNKCQQCKDCPSGYRTDITSSSCGAGTSFVRASSMYGCAKCETIACEAGYSTSTTSCADGQTLKSQTTNANCKTCTGTACESGYKTGTTCNAATQNTVKQSSNSNCVKCTQKTCEEQGKKTCNGTCIAATACCTDSDCASNKKCKNGSCVSSGQLINCADGYSLIAKDCRTGYELVSEPGKSACTKCEKVNNSFNPNPGNNGGFQTNDYDYQDTCCLRGYPYVCPAGYGTNCMTYKKNRCCADASGTDGSVSYCRAHCTE